MPIPAWTASGVLPPFAGETPTDSAQMAPYAVTFREFANRFGTTQARWKLLRGLAAYRAALRATEVQSGFQWLDGSFLEDVESLRGRAPADIDVVSFVLPPQDVSPGDWLVRHADLLRPGAAKRLYGCDAYLVHLSLGMRRPDQLVHQARYWYGLFSHQRSSQLWKGMLLIDLFADDSLGDEWLSKEMNHAAED